MGVTQAELRAAALTERLTRIEAQQSRTVAPFERVTLKRDCERANLRLEKEKVKLKELERGPDAIARCEAERNRLQKELDLRTLEHDVRTRGARLLEQVAGATKDLSQASYKLDKMTQALDACTLVAPCDGIVQHLRINSEHVITKVSVGAEVCREMPIMRVSDYSRAVVRLPIPEQYFEKVCDGMEVSVEIESYAEGAIPGRIARIEYFFKNRKKKQTKPGIYGSHEALGEAVFFVHVELNTEAVTLEPGTVAKVRFPFHEE